MTNTIKNPIEISNFSEIEEKYDSIICDIWGVIHNGQELFKSSIECLLRLELLHQNLLIIVSLDIHVDSLLFSFNC